MIFIKRLKPCCVICVYENPGTDLHLHVLRIRGSLMHSTLKLHATRSVAEGKGMSPTVPSTSLSVMKLGDDVIAVS